MLFPEEKCDILYRDKVILFARTEREEKMKLSLVIPCYNEQDNVELFYNTATEAFKDKGFEYELIFVNDGSRDQTMDKLRHIYDIADENVKVVGFSRNFWQGVCYICGTQGEQGRNGLPYRRRYAAAPRACA